MVFWLILWHSKHVPLFLNWNKLAYVHFLTHMVTINLYVINITLHVKPARQRNKENDRSRNRKHIIERNNND